MGYPMSHSTQFGFREPPTSLSSLVASVAIRRSTLPPLSSFAKSGQFAPLSLNSRAVGVGHILTCCPIVTDCRTILPSGCLRYARSPGLAGSPSFV